MRTPGILTIIGLGMLVPAGCGRAPDSARGGDAGASSAPTTNAAETYHAVYTALGDALLEQIKSDGASDAQLAAHGAELDRLTEATRQPTCEFEVDLTSGMDAELRHLAELRALARALRADAARLLRAGDTDRAARRCAAILRMSVHLARDGRFVIELLTASAIAALGADFVIENAALADAPSKTDIQIALADVERDGTLGCWTIIEKDVERSARWIEEGRAPDFSSKGGENWPAKTPAERQAAARALLDLLDESAAAWLTPDAIRRLNRISASAASQGVDDFYPQLARVRTAIDELNVVLAEAKAMLQQ